MQPLCYYIGRTGENSMSKYCRPIGLYVTYMDCMECEDKGCITKREEQTNVNMGEQSQTKIAKSVPCMESANLQKGDTNMALTKRYLSIEPEQTVFVVFASKREGYNDNIVIRCKVKECIVRRNSTLYCLRKEKVVTGQKRIDTFIDSFMCENANIDTGYRGLQIDKYPVFTTKEKCIEWLKDL